MKNNRTFLEKLLDGAEIEWKPLIDLAEIGTGNSNRQDEEENGKYPFYVRSKNILRSNSFQFDETAIIIPGEGGIGDIFHYVEGKYALHQRAYRIHITSDKVNTKFLYYIMHNSFKKYILSKSVGATAISIRKPMLEKFEIPIPPLSVQTEIVKILDALTALTSELTSELILRQKQYEYYREKLLNIDEINKVIELGDVGPVRMCKRILKNQTASSGDIPFYKIGTFGKKPDAYISNALFQEYKQKYSYPKKGDILISASGTIGRTVIFDGENSYFQDSNIVWIDNDETLVLNKYLYHFYKIAKWGIAEGGTIQRLYNDNLKKVKISIPPLKEQQRIVSILDKFETLTNSITEGLPLAIEQSQKRYEYYRELLLNFHNP
ncbi:TPA: restriction endonuclease subunit S [Haemophilus influenzae]